MGVNDDVSESSFNRVGNMSESGKSGDGQFNFSRGLAMKMRRQVVEGRKGKGWRVGIFSLDGR